MSKNPEKKDWSQLSDQEKRAEEKRLEEEEKKIKEIGWEEKLKERQKMIKEVAEREKLKEPVAELTKEKEEKEAAEKELAKAYPEPRDKEKELERLIKETEDELSKKLEQEKKTSGKELSGTEIYHLTRDFYREKLGYQIEHKGFFGGRVRVKDKEGKYVLDEKTGKPVEFKKVSKLETETPLIKFLKEKYKNKIRESLEKEAPETTKEKEKIKEQEKREKEAKEAIEKEAERLIKEKKDEFLSKQRKLSGEGLSAAEIYNLTRNFYLGELGYELKYKGLLRGKARVWNEKEGKYLLDKKTGKPIEFKASFSPKGETPFLKFLEEEYKNKIKERLKKTAEEIKQRVEKTEIAEKVTAAKETKEGKTELKKEDINQMSEKVREVTEKWEVYLKEMGIETPVETEKEKKQKPIAVITERGSIYRYLPDGRTQRFKTATGELFEVQDILVFIPPYDIIKEGALKLFPHQFEEIKSEYQYDHDVLLPYVYNKEYRSIDENKSIQVIDENGKELHNPTDLEKAGKVFLRFVTKPFSKSDFILPVSVEPKIGYSTFDASYDKEDKHGEIKLKEKHLGHKVKEIKYAEATEKTKESKEPAKKPLSRAEFYANYLRATGLTEKDLNQMPEKQKEVQQRWEAYQKEMGIETPKEKKEKISEEKKAEEKKGETAKVTEKEEEKKEPVKPKEPEKKEEGKKKKGIDFKKMKTDGAFERIKEMNIEKNAEDIIEIIKNYGSEIFLPPYAANLLKKYDQLRPEQYKFEKVKGKAEDLKKWLAIFLTDIRYPERLKKLRELKLKPEKKEENSSVKAKETEAVVTKITEEKELGERTIKAAESLKVGEEEGEEEIEKWQKKKKKESAGEKKKLEWLEHAEKLRKNGTFKFKITPELKKFFRERGYTSEQIREISKSPEVAWDKALEIYNKEQKESEEK